MRDIGMRARWVIPCVLGFVAACAEAELTQNGTSSVTFLSETALPSVNFDSGLLPEGSPVRLQLKANAVGKETISAAAKATGSIEAPKMTGEKGTGKLSLSGKFALEGRLVVDVDGLPQKYDGPIPGLDNLNIEFANSASFDPFLVAGAVTSTGAIAEVDLPPIPLPGGIPGTLKFHVAKGSSVSTTFSGACAAISGDIATYTGTLKRGGRLILKPTIELKIPVIGERKYPLPEVVIPMPTPAQPVALKASPVTFVDSAIEGELATVGTCAVGKPAADGGIADTSTVPNAPTSPPDPQDAGGDTETGAPPVLSSCAASSSESSPKSTFTLTGDGTTAHMQTLTGTTASWYRVGLVETSLATHNFKVGVILSPAYGGADFDVYVKRYASAASTTPVATFQSEVTGTNSGVSEKIEFVIPDTDVNDEPSFSVEVRAKNGSSCDDGHPWTLYVYAGSANHI